MSDPALQLSATQHGVVTTTQLRRYGLTKSAIQHLVRSGEWRSAARGVLVRRGSPASPEQRVLVAVLDVGRSAVASHLTAAWLWGLPGGPPATIEVSSSNRKATSRFEGVAVRYPRVLPASWLTSHNAVPVVRPELLALHLFADHPHRAVRLVDSLWSKRLLSGRSLAALLAQLGERGRNGTAGLRVYLDERGVDYQPPASGIESRLDALMKRYGVAVRRQVDLGGERWSARVDFLCEGTRVVVEVQSELYHASLSDGAADAERRRRLEADGFTVVEVWDAELFHRPDAVVDRIMTAIHSSS